MTERTNQGGDIPEPIQPHAPRVSHPPPAPLDGPGKGAEGAGTGERAETPPEGALTAPRAPGSPVTEPPPGEHRDPWRDRLRVVWDRMVYLAVIFAVYKLRMVDKLDHGTGIGLLLLAGIRVENLAEFLLKRAAVAPGSRAAAVLFMVQTKLQANPDALRSWFRG